MVKLATEHLAAQIEMSDGHLAQLGMTGGHLVAHLEMSAEILLVPEVAKAQLELKGPGKN